MGCRPANGTAAKAGLRDGDVLLELGGKLVTDSGTLLRLLNAEAIGRTLTARILRNGGFHSLDVTPGQRPASRIDPPRQRRQVR